MSSFEETIARMKGLYTYGKELNENNNFNTHTLEYHAIGADGKSYGIIKECNKYYIKTAPQSKEMVAEAYDYIGGFCNRKSYEYNSYASALKNFEMKLASINEAFDGNVNISTLDPFRKEEYIVEGTRKMQDEIARCRQIMYNAAMIMNESIEGVGASKQGDVVKNNTKRQPEAPKSGKVDEVTKGETVKTPKENPSAGVKGNKPGKDGVYTESPKGIKEGKCCEKCGKEQCTCKNCNEESGDIGDNPLMPNTENWGTEGIGKGRDPKSVGWEMDGQKNVNEETDEWDEGLPGSAGIGDGNTSNNNDPFNKSINEEDEDDFNDTESDDFNDVENDDYGDEEGGDNFSDEEGADDMSTDTDFDAGLDDEYSDGEDGDEFGDDENMDLGGEEGTDDEISNDENDLGGGDEDLQAQIDALKAQIEELQAQLNGENDDFSDEEGGDEFGDEFSDDFSDEEGGDEFGDDFSSEDGGDEFGDDTDDFSGEEGGDDFSDDTDDFSGEEGGDDFSDDTDDFSGEGSEDYSDEEDLDECGVGGGMPQQNAMMEAKRRKMNKIIESVTRRILKEDELHDFGKHPGYRKKPMELPSTGEDKNKWGRDWNDDSVHGEEPFGSKIGDGDPFNQLVNAITKDVMYQLKKGIPIEGENKKKEE